MIFPGLVGVVTTVGVVACTGVSRSRAIGSNSRPLGLKILHGGLFCQVFG